MSDISKSTKENAGQHYDSPHNKHKIKEVSCHFKNLFHHTMPK